MSALHVSPDGWSEEDEPAAERAAQWVIPLVAVSGAVVVNYLALTALVALALISSNGAFAPATLLATGVPAWLAAHHVPLIITGESLGVLPLFLVGWVVLVIAGWSRWALRRLGWDVPARSGVLVAAMGGGHAVLGAVAAVLAGGAVSAVPVEAFLGCGLVAAFGATLGALREGGLREAVLERADPVVSRGLWVGARILCGFLGVGLVLVLLSVAFSASDVAAIYHGATAHGGETLGLTALSLLYLPNAMVAGISFVVGPGFSVGEVVAGPFAANGGDLPAVPLLAAVPSGPAPVWWWVVLAVPAAAGGLVGWWCRDTHVDPVQRLRAVAVAAGVVSSGCFLLAALSGGQLASGSHNPVSVPSGLVGVAVLCWIAVPGAAVVWFAGVPAAPSLTWDEDDHPYEVDAEGEAWVQDTFAGEGVAEPEIDSDREAEPEMESPEGADLPREADPSRAAPDEA